MTVLNLTEEEKAVEPRIDESSPPVEVPFVSEKGGTERDILQLVEEVMRDALCVHVIVDGLRGRGRSQIEEVLRQLPWTTFKGGTERDILQFAHDLPELTPEVLKAIDHLLGNRSFYLDALKQLAEREPGYEFDWRKMPGPVQP